MSMLMRPYLHCYCPICKVYVSPYTKNIEETEYKDVSGHVLTHKWIEKEELQHDIDYMEQMYMSTFIKGKLVLPVSDYRELIQEYRQFCLTDKVPESRLRLWGIIK
jgi:hypothetical protein